MFNKKIKIGIFFLFVLLVSFLPTPFLLFIATGNPNSFEEALTRQKLNAEQDNTDSFDVHPKSGRWPSVTDTNTDDRIVDGNLRMIGSNNGSESHFNALRGLSKTDSSVEYRYRSAMDNQSQVEFFRDVIGDKCDFDESDRDCLSGDFYTPVSVTVADGTISFGANNAGDGIGTGPIVNDYFNLDIYHTIEIKYKVDINSGTSNVRIEMKDVNFAGSQINTRQTWSLTENGEWQTETLSITREMNAAGYNGWSFLIIERDTSPDTTIFIDYFKLFGDLDFSTHYDDGPEDTHDWEDSTEYWYDQEGDVKDFVDGTTEGLTSQNGTLSNYGSQMLQISNTGKVDYFCNYLGDCADFEEGDAEGITFTDTNSIANGVLTVSQTNSYLDLIWNDIDHDTSAFSIDKTYSVVFEIKFNITGSLAWVTRTSEFDGGDVEAFTSTGFWQTLTFTLDFQYSPSKWYQYPWNNLQMYFFYPTSTTDDMKMEIKSIHFFTGYDYSEDDTWDWQDSTDYFYHVFGNISDFDDGSLEYVGEQNGTFTNYNSQYLQISNDGLIEYYCNIVGDCMDFEEGDIEGLSHTYSTITYSNGKLLAQDDSAFSWVYDYPNTNIPLDLIDSVEIRFKTNKSTSMIWYLRSAISEYQYTTINGANSTCVTLSSWCTWRFDPNIHYTYRLPTFNPHGNFYGHALATQSTEQEMQIDYIKIFFQYDYNSMVDSDLDGWNWDDAGEYFYDSYGNVSDYNDGTTEQSYPLNGTLSNNGSEFLQISNDGNIEYFCQETGDCLDFQEGDQEVFTTWYGVTRIITVDDGYLNVSATGTTGVQTYSLATGFGSSNPLSGVVYDTAYVRAKGNQVGLQMRLETTAGAALYTPTMVMDTDWQIFTLTWTASTNTKTVIALDLLENSGEGNLDGDEIWYIDYIMFVGHYDYFTFDPVGTFSDTIDFEDSVEYSYDTLGNVTDFNDGTTEGVSTTTGSVSITNVVSKYLGVSYTGGGSEVNLYKTVSIDTSIYSWFTFEFRPNSGSSFTAINITDGTNSVCYDSTGWSAPSDAAEFYLFSCDLSLDADWTGTETTWEIIIEGFDSGENVYINMVYIYDVEFGDVEGMGLDSYEYHYVDPAGYYTTAFPSLDTGSENIPFGSATSVDYSKYETCIIRIKTDASSRFLIQNRDKSKTYSAYYDIGTSFTIFTIDLSADSDWNSTEDIFNILHRETASGGTYFEGNEKIYIDYIMFVGYQDLDYYSFQMSELSIDSSTYEYSGIEFISYSENISQIDVYYNGSLVCSDSTGWTGGTWNLITCYLGGDADWTGTVGDLTFIFTASTNFTTSDILLINMVYIWTDGTGDLEGWGSVCSAGLVYTTPYGYYFFRAKANLNLCIAPPNDRVIDANSFYTLTIRIKGSANTGFYVGDSVGNTIVSFQTLSTSFQTFTFDLSLDVDWTGTESRIIIYLRGDGGSVDFPDIGDSYTIDYIYITANHTLSDYSFQISDIGVIASGATGYDYLAIEFYSSGEAITEIEVIAEGNSVCIDSSGWSADTWNLFNCDLDLDADWTGTIGTFYIRFNSTTGINISEYLYVNMIYLYPDNLGDVETWTGSPIYYVEPYGYYVSRPALASAEVIWENTLTTSFTTNEFQLVNFSFYPTEDLHHIRLYCHDPSASDFYCSDLLYPTTSIWNDYSIDIYSFSGSKTIDRIGIAYYDDVGNFEGTELVKVDYFLVLANTTFGNYSFAIDDISITSSTYRFNSIEFYSPTETITQIDIYAENNLVCSSSTGWSTGYWHLFSCDLGLDGDWTGTINNMFIIFEGTDEFNVSEYLYINMFYLYDTSLGDHEGIAGDTGDSGYYYTNPLGYHTQAHGLVTSTRTPFVQSTTNWDLINMNIFNTLKIKARAICRDATCNSGTSYNFAINFYSTTGSFVGGGDVITTFAPNGAWNVITYDLTTDSQFSSTDGYFGDSRIQYYAPGAWFEIDYLLFINSDPAEQEFVLGFYNQDDEAYDLFNMTHHFFDSETYRWEAELYSSDGNIASYYYSANQTLSAAGYAGVDTESFVNGFSNNTDTWSESGTTPYLSAVDTTNYISATTTKSLMRWFTFSDISSSHTTGFDVDLGIYILVSDGISDIKYYIDLTGDNTAEITGTFNNPVGGWNLVSLNSLTTLANINAARISLEYITSSSSEIRIDAVKLAITHDSTLSTSSCFNTYCRIKISYDVLTSDFDIEIRSDADSRIFKIDWTDEFTTIDENPKLFSFEKAPYIFFDQQITYYGSLETWIDYIIAPYKEQEWIQSHNPGNEPNWIADSYDYSQAIASIGVSSNPYSSWELTVPYLDATSGEMYQDFTNYTMIALDRTYSYFRLLAVDWDTGTRNEIFEIQLESQNGRFVYVNGFDNFAYDLSTTSSPKVTFSIALLQERSVASIRVRFVPDVTDLTVYTDIVDNVSLSTVSSKASQEFVLESEYMFDRLNNAGSVKLQLNSFSFIEKDIFADIGNFIGGIVDGGGDIVGQVVGLILGPIIDVIRWLAGILLSGFGALLGILQAALEVALSALGAVLGPLIQALIDFYDSTLGPFLSDVLTFITDFIGNFLSDLADFIENTVIPLLEDALQFLVSVAVDLFSLLLGIALDLWELFWTFIFGLVDSSGELNNQVNAFVNYGWQELILDGLDLIIWLINNAIWFFLLLVAIFWTLAMISRATPQESLFYTLELNSKGPKGSVGFIAGVQFILPIGLILFLIYIVFAGLGTLPNVFSFLFP